MFVINYVFGITFVLLRYLKPDFDEEVYSRTKEEYICLVEFKKSRVPKSRLGISIYDYTSCDIVVYVAIRSCVEKS